MPLVPAEAVATTVPVAVKPVKAVKATKPAVPKEVKPAVAAVAVTVPKKAKAAAKPAAAEAVAVSKKAVTAVKKAAAEIKVVKVTVLMRALKALLAGEMTSSEVQAAIELSHSLKITLDKEVVKGTLVIVPPKGDVTVAKYKLTAAGKKIAEKL